MQMNLRARSADGSGCRTSIIVVVTRWGPTVFVALRELRRAKVRFGLLAGAVGLLVFLILFQQTLLGSLIGAVVGAVESQSAPALVLARDARGQLDASVLEPEVVDAVGEVEGVSMAAPWQLSTFSARIADADELVDVVLVGHLPDGPGAPATLVDGRPVAAAGEAIAPAGREADGFELGALVALAPDAGEVEVVGLATGLEYLVQPALFVDLDSYDEAARARSPEAPFVPVNAVAVDVEGGTDLTEVQATIEADVDDVRALTRQEAADGIPGVDAIGQSFAVILLLAFAVVGLVTGIFFLILTVQKSEALTLLRGVGASARDVTTPLLLQVTLVTLLGVLIGVGLLAVTAAAAGDATGLAIELDVGLAATTGAGILVLGLVASLAAVRRVLAIEPFDVTTRANVGGSL